MTLLSAFKMLEEKKNKELYDALSSELLEALGFVWEISGFL